MSKHNLDDLIIDEIHPTNNKTKGILTILALLVVVLVVAIVLTKVILKEPKVDAVVIDDSKKFISPELKLKSSKIDTKKKPLKSQMDNVDDIPKASDEYLDDIDEELAIDKPTVTTTKVEQQPTQEEIKPKVSVDKAKVDKKKETGIKKVQITDEFEQVKPSKYNTKQKVDYKYYIQVGSFSKRPSGQFLSVIKKSGFKYTILSTSSGIKKLLIGPYSSREAVDRVLPKVRDRITKGAFVYKVK